jgi:hypothetical protein
MEKRIEIKLPKKSIEKGNTTKSHEEQIYLKKCKFGEVFVVYDKTIHPENGRKHWHLYYPLENWHTGGFESKQKAINWYENKGR